MSLKLLYVLMGGAGALPLPPSELLHLNQAGVQHLICNLTDAQASTPLAYKIRPTSSEQAFFHPRWILTLLPVHQQDG